MNGGSRWSGSGADVRDTVKETVRQGNNTASTGAMALVPVENRGRVENLWGRVRRGLEEVQGAARRRSDRTVH